MLKLISGGLAIIALAALSGCSGKGGGVMGRAGPDEFAVARQAPLVVPPDFSLTPPRPGAPRPQEADSSTQALQTLFGGQRQRSASEAAIIDQAGGAEAPGVRSTVSNPSTPVVNKGGAIRDILTAPESTSPEASATVPR